MWVRLPVPTPYYFPSRTPALTEGHACGDVASETRGSPRATNRDMRYAWINEIYGLHFLHPQNQLFPNRGFSTMTAGPPVNHGTKTFHPWSREYYTVGVLHIRPQSATDVRLQIPNMACHAKGKGKKPLVRLEMKKYL